MSDNLLKKYQTCSSRVKTHWWRASAHATATMSPPGMGCHCEGMPEATSAQSGAQSPRHTEVASEGLV